MNLFFIALIVIALLLMGFAIYSSRDVEGIDRHLLEAVKGDRALAKRLLEHAKFKYPGKSDRWYVEKIIYDLERDRAGGRNSHKRRFTSRQEMRENIFLVGGIVWLLSAVTSLVQNLFRGR